MNFWEDERKLAAVLVGILLVAGIAVYSYKFNLFAAPGMSIPYTHYYKQGEQVTSEYTSYTSQLGDTQKSNIYSTYGYVVLSKKQYSDHKSQIDNWVNKIDLYAGAGTIAETTHYDDIWATEVDVGTGISSMKGMVSNPVKIYQSPQGDNVDLCSYNGRNCHNTISFSAPSFGYTPQWKEYVVVATQCSKQDPCEPFGCGISPWNYKCDADMFHIIVTQDDFCGDLPGFSSVENWGETCYNYGDRPHYCSENYIDAQGQHRCIDPCGARCDGENQVCLASTDYVPSRSSFNELIEKSKEEGGNLCYSSDYLCDSIADCRQMYFTSRTNTQEKIHQRTTGLDYIQGYTCDKSSDVSDPLVSYINSLGYGKVGLCKAGAETPGDCSGLMGPSSDYTILTSTGEAVSGSGWGVKDGVCYLGECDDSSRCGTLYKSQAVKCELSTKVSNLRVCRRKTCENHLDCANVEYFAEEGMVYACDNGYCKKATEEEYPDLKGISVAYCEARMDKTLNPPKTWVIQDGKCVEKTQYESQCNPSASPSTIKQQCIDSGKECPDGFNYDCKAFANYPDVGICHCVKEPSPKINCQTQTVYDNKDEWCMRNCKPSELPRCKRYACTRNQLGTGCINCGSVSATCEDDSDCWVGNYQKGRCIGGCCDYSGIPPSCQTNEDCDYDEVCKENNCVALDCEPGYEPKDHKCVPKGKFDFPLLWIILFFGVGTLIGWVANKHRSKKERKEYTLLFGVVLALFPLIVDQFIQLPNIEQKLITYFEGAIPKCDPLDPSTYWVCGLPSWWFWALAGLIVGAALGAIAGASLLGIGALPGVIIGAVGGLISGFILHGLLKLLQIPITIGGTALSVYFSYTFLEDMIENRYLVMVLALLAGAVAGFLLFTKFWIGLILVAIYFLLRAYLGGTSLDILDKIKE